jgi:parvulin-like peptidyl-prolyl isomerase
LLESGDQNLVNLARQNPQAFLGAIFVMRYLTAEAEKTHLAEQSPTKEQLEILRSRVLIQAMVNQIREGYSVPEQAIDDFYAHNKSRYETARIKVIAIGFCPSVSPTGGTSVEDIKKAAEAAVQAAHCPNKRTEDQAHNIALGLVGRIRGGEDFVKLVKEYSEDADSKATDGDFGLVTRDNSFKPEIKAAVFSLSEGEVSDPISSGTFFYVIKIKEKAVQPLSNVREPIIQELKQKHFIEWNDDINKRLQPAIERPDFFTTPVAPKPSGPPQLIPKP